MLEFKPKFNLNNSAIDDMINSPGGDVGRWLRRKGRQMEAAAKRDVGVRTGRLKRSIKRKHERVPRGQQMVIGAYAIKPGMKGSYAHDHHEGTPSHIIVGPVGKLLVFRKGGRTIRVHGVRHPGTHANKFLTKQFIFLKTP
jgi:hypothetical protein